MSTEVGRRASRAAWERLARSATRFVFPARCLGCGQAEPERLQGGVCPACWELTASRVGPACARCAEHLSSPEPGLCGRCLLQPPEFRALSAVAAYSGAPRAILLAFKFRGADYLAPHLARRMAARLPLPDGADEVASVPAVRGQRLRRDHPADQLAAAVAAELSIPLARERLVKVRRTLRQSSLPLARRAENVRGAFRAARPAPRRVLLIDDVATSCSTARACARELLRAGAVTVDVWCFARATRDEELAAGA